MRRKCQGCNQRHDGPTIECEECKVNKRFLRDLHRFFRRYGLRGKEDVHERRRRVPVYAAKIEAGLKLFE